MNAEGPVLTPPVDERDHIQGPQNAPVTLVEYGDYECPYCGAAYPILKHVQNRMGNRMRFVYRHFPLTNKHPHALRAAEAAEAADAQGEFWEMHDLLYQTQQSLEFEDLIADAESLDLDAEQFANDLAHHVYISRIEEDQRSGYKSGVHGTPTFFINGVLYEGETDFESLMAAVLAPVRSHA